MRGLPVDVELSSIEVVGAWCSDGSFSLPLGDLQQVIDSGREGGCTEASVSWDIELGLYDFYTTAVTAVNIKVTAVPPSEKVIDKVSYEKALSKYKADLKKFKEAAAKEIVKKEAATRKKEKAEYQRLKAKYGD